MGIVQIYAPINVKPQGEGVGHVVGSLTFSFKIIQIPHPWDKIIGQKVHPAASEGGKMSFVRSRSIACQRSHTIKVPTRGRELKMKLLWLARLPFPPPWGLTFYRCIIFMTLEQTLYLVLKTRPSYSALERPQQTSFFGRINKFMW